MFRRWWEKFYWRKQQPRVRLGLRLGLVEPKARKQNMIEIKLTNEQKIKVTLTPTTAAGKPAALDGKPQWRTDGPAALEVAEDGMSAYLIASERPSESIVTITADADLGEGVEEIAEGIKLITEGAKAAHLGLTIGEPELQ